MLGGDALRVELHAMERPLMMLDAHHEPVIALRRDGEAVRQRIAPDDERMVARRLKRARQAGEDAGAGMPDGCHLAMHWHWRSHHLAAEDLADRLMAEADAEDRHRSRLGDEIEAD